MSSSSHAADYREAVAPVRRRKLRRFLRYTFYALLLLAVILMAAHFVWKSSGSGEWELVREEAGVKVWNRKTPGFTQVQVRAETQVRSSMAGMLTLLEDLDSCVDAYCYDERRLEQLPSLPGRAATYVRFRFDIPGLKSREYVLFAERYQDPNTRQVDINIMSAPNRLPRDPCCVRVTHLNNTWKLTPRADGMLGIEFMQDTDLGGLPYFVTNLALTEGTFAIMEEMQSILDKDTYRNARVEGILEYAP